MKKVLIVLSLAAIAVVAFAATAQAHTLSLQKANAVAFRVAEKDCNRDVDCTDYGAFKNNCRRASPHRVRCYALNVGTYPDGSQYGCERAVLVKIRNDSFNLIYVQGDRICSRI